jgi:hypothetical protein
MRRFLQATTFGLTVACGGFHEPTVEEQIIATIEAVTDGAQRANLAETLSPISPRYQDVDGLSRDGLKGLLFREFHRNGPITSIIGAIDVEVGEPPVTAQASFDAVLMTGLSLLDGRPLPDQIEAWHFEVDLAREGEDWRITGHERQRGLDATQLLEQREP